MIRYATIDDAERLLEIYSPYVEKTAITFEYEVPKLDDFKDRIIGVSQRYPYLVLEENGVITGYTYASYFNKRKAYDRSAEISIYMCENNRRRGKGRLLYETMERLLKLQGIVNIYACIASTEVVDEYLTMSSIDFHTKMGYRIVGNFYKCAYKFGRWYDMVWMEKVIGEHSDDPAEFTLLRKVRDEADEIIREINEREGIL